ncbi:hypothetical protein AMIS_47900 [Actinoplanes missouriensis 431]|uniref:Uncharacterized protein n=1 Tax=Actinoplanes missouriensis (strain ATCC 14538 / DSM 43046 / CBS 188.64 / JCM 3121 / NBRC 102363 / NCIMB 12654 / NRRL B-3342 / UNCC 431) TaxID=512565 RepID=I0HAH3_ACTM4|nr:hypothetical protein [Actinoplanes missouriensis]BAL90010.1 hypothetical protein AMIS_47900 [Actinoplanes missouriensis 431]
MTDFAIRLPQTQSSAVAGTPIRWRMRGAAMAAAVVLGTAGSTAVTRSADHGVAVAPITTAVPSSPAATGISAAIGTAAAFGTAAVFGTVTGFGSATAAGPAGVVPVSAAPLRAFVYDSATGSVREIA